MVHRAARDTLAMCQIFRGVCDAAAAPSRDVATPAEAVRPRRPSGERREAEPPSRYGTAPRGGGEPDDADLCARKQREVPLSVPGADEMCSRSRRGTRRTHRVQHRGRPIHRLPPATFSGTLPQNPEGVDDTRDRDRGGPTNFRRMSEVGRGRPPRITSSGDPQDADADSGGGDVVYSTGKVRSSSRRPRRRGRLRQLGSRARAPKRSGRWR